MKELKVQRFIREHSDWEKILSEKPYSISISRDSVFGKDLVMLKYSQIDSDFSDPVVCECRGLVLEDKTFEVVECPYFKFFNAHEPHAANIDWSTAFVSEKIDGSLVKIVKLPNSELLMSTNGVIDAHKAGIAPQPGCQFRSFGEIVDNILAEKVKNGFDFRMLREGFTYMFELVSPWTRVVIPHEKADLYFHGVRDNTTFEEHKFTDDPIAKWFSLPKVYPLKSLDECFAAAEKLPWNDEGYVVCDGSFRRVKVKGTSYLAAHRLAGNGVMSAARAVEIVRMNEVEEVCAYFEHFRSGLMEVKEKFDALCKRLDASAEKLKLKQSMFSSRKEAALWIQKEFREWSGMGFALLDSRVSSPRSWLMTASGDKIVKALGYKE